MGNIKLNRVFIASVLRNMENHFRDFAGISDTLNGVDKYFEGLVFECDIDFPANTKFEVYEEGDVVVIGLPLSAGKLSFSPNWPETYGVYKGINNKRKEELRDFLPMSDQEFLDSFSYYNNFVDTYKKYFEPHLDSLNKCTYKIELKRDDRPSFKRRDCIPIFILDFEKKKVAVSGGWGRADKLYDIDDLLVREGYIYDWVHRSKVDLRRIRYTAKIPFRGKVIEFSSDTYSP